MTLVSCAVLSLSSWASLSNLNARKSQRNGNNNYVEKNRSESSRHWSWQSWNSCFHRTQKGKWFAQNHTAAFHGKAETRAFYNVHHTNSEARGGAAENTTRCPGSVLPFLQFTPNLTLATRLICISLDQGVGPEKNITFRSVFDDLTKCTNFNNA